MKTRTARGTFARQRSIPWDGTAWDDGYVNGRGYFTVYRPDHPGASRMGYARRHHVVWWLNTGTVVATGMVLHHINHVKTDDRFDNLQLMEHGEHTRLHCAKPGVECVCKACGKTFAVPQWRLNQEENRGSYCSQKCSHKGVRR